MKNLFISTILLIISIHLFAQNKTQTYAWEDEKYPRERYIDMERMVVDVTFDPAAGIVNGQVTHYFKPLRKTLDSVFFDAPKINIKQVFLNGKKANFKSSEEGVIVFCEKSLVWETQDSIRIQYQAKPKKGIYFIGWNDKNNLSRKQIWTQGQGVDNRYWIPMWDDLNDKMITETIVRFDQKYKVLSNGTKAMERINKDGTKTWHYKMTKPHSSYLLMLGIGEYDIKEVKSKSGVPLRMYYYPEHKDRVDYIYRNTTDIMNFFENEIGVPYPWESYSQIPVQDFMYGAMENTTATVFGDFFCADKRSFNDRNYVGVNAHEMAHQWFGDMVTARCEPHHWLQESFATYYNMMAEREIFGQDYFDWSRRNSQNSAIDADSKDLYPVASSNGGSTRFYPKGAIVLNTLKYVTGKEEYNKAIKYYLQKHGYKNVDSHDLLVAFEESLGLSLGWFWEEWLYKAGEPEFQVSFQNTKNYQEKSEHHFIVNQIQTVNDYTSVFKMPVILEIYYQDGTFQSKKFWLNENHHEFVLPNTENKQIAYVLFDPNAQIPKKIDFPKSVEMLLAQAQNAQFMIDRYDAWLALRNINMEQKRSLLQHQYYVEKWHGIKGEILSQLMYDDDVKSKEIVRLSFTDKSTDIRKTVIAKMHTIPAEYKAHYELFLQDSSYDIIASSLEKLCIDFPDDASKYLETTKGIIGVRARNVELKWIEMNLAQKGSQDLFNKLVNYTSNSYEFQTRTAAMTILKKFNYFDAYLMENCFDAMFNPNSRLANPAADILKYFKAQYTYRFMIENRIAELISDNYQKDIIKRNL
ncbi:MAG TPA: M1 family metallopeptidase [Bacteroidia bacterium]|nr:M1 family metallopeptidase [Bacteroidia bacterium]